MSAAKPRVLESKRLASGVTVRIQQRGKAFDVTRNSTGYVWRYVEKAVTEDRARNTFDLLTLEAP